MRRLDTGVFWITDLLTLSHLIVLVLLKSLIAEDLNKDCLENQDLCLVARQSYYHGPNQDLHYCSL